jgi:hypothetical protein
MAAFFSFADNHLNSENFEKLIYICIKKVIIRFLVFLRDLLLVKSFFLSRAVADHQLILDSDPEKNIFEQKPRIRSDVQCILMLYTDSVSKTNQYKLNYDANCEDGLDDSAYSKSSKSILALLSNTSMHVIAGNISEGSIIESIIAKQCFIEVLQFDHQKIL